MKTKTLIIGQGLAGTLLALHLIRKGEDVLVIDNNHQHASTKVAAGMMTPIRGKRLVKNWEDDTTYQSVIQHYQTIEQQLDTFLIQHHTLHRILLTDEEKKALEKKKNNPDYTQLLNTPLSTKQLDDIIHHDTIGFTLNPISQVNLPKLLNTAKDYLLNHHHLIQDTLDYAQIQPHTTHITYNNIQAKRLIFCEGHRAIHNPFLKHLNFENAKGEIIELHCDALPKNTIFNNGKWLCPYDSEHPHHYKFGTTSYWDFKDTKPEDNTSKQLTQALTKLLKAPYTVKHIDAGIRPVLKERKPSWGFLEDYPNIGYINGLGGQGTLLAPQVINNWNL